MSLRAARLLLRRGAPVATQAWRRGAPALALRSAQSLRGFSDRGAPPPSDNTPARGAPPPKELEPHDWHPVVDPETQGTYYHNPMTGLVTAVGVEKPAWEPVEANGGVYWWNIDTDETTAIGEPCPALQQQPGQGGQLQQQQGFALGQPQQQGGGMMSGLGQTMAQGMAFGAGSSVAHSVMGSMFGGGSSSHETVDHNSGGGGDDWGDGGGDDDWA